MLTFIKLLSEILQLITVAIRNKKISDAHALMQDVKAAKTDEERQALARKISDFWAKP